MEGQRNIFEVMTEFNPPVEGDFDSYRRCEYCVYFRTNAWSKEKRCIRERKYSHECFRPNAFIIPRLCGSCDYGNQFCKEKNYCTGKEENRRPAFPDKVLPWNEWHDNKEFDTCDKYKSRRKQLWG